jgi:serine/threonine protein kinase/tetratricopeptide (TPR) repeat protein
MIGRTLGHYKIERTLGAGGMGRVFSARDLKLERRVAVKLIHEALDDPSLRDRFWREARAAAAIGHPGICQVFEIGEQDGELFIVMELLEGEPLMDRLLHGPMPLDEVLRLGLEVLDVLGALHGRGFIHRDLKPSNLFLLRDGRVKLLDFGLVLPTALDAAPGRSGLTMAGLAIGSPGYMSPEQIHCEPVDARTDLFALGAVLHEAIRGTRAFAGSGPVDIQYAVLHHAPAPILGSPRHEAVGRVLARAMSKRPAERPASAEAMAADLRAAGGSESSASHPGATPSDGVVRLAVLPFRMLRADPERDFLGPSLADALAMSLAGIRSLIVRSTVASARFATATPDLREIATALEVDVVLTGTVLPVGERCRVAAQLVQAPRGDVLWSQTYDVSGHDIFQLQDALTRKLVESLQLPLSSRERGALNRNAPASATGYEFFLRANRAATVGEDLTVARDLYRRALEADPGYALAWARLGRCHRLTGKYYASNRHEHYSSAEDALDRALELQPDLPAAHHMYALLDLDLGHPERALDRLLRVVERNPNDPEGWAGLVAAFRYVGMIDESLACHAEARRLDPEIRTSVSYSLESIGELDRALEEGYENGPLRAWLLMRMHRMDESIEEVRRFASTGRQHLMIGYTAMIEAMVRRDEAGMLLATKAFDDFPDPEGVYSVARAMAHFGDRSLALRWFAKAVDGGYANVIVFRSDPFFEFLREAAAYGAILSRAETHHLQAVATYRGRLTTLAPAG